MGFDWGEEGNQEPHGQPQPPLYHLEDVNTQVIGLYHLEDVNTQVISLLFTTWRTSTDR